MRSVLAGRSLKRLVSGMTMLPSLPDAYRRLVDTLAPPDASNFEVSQVIMSDMAMTAKVLQLANSAFFGVLRQVNHPADATRYLGVETIRALALTVGVFSEFSGPPAAGAMLKKLQSHAVMTAHIVQVIAAAEKLEKPVAAAAYLAGLLHDVGKLILINKDPEIYESAMAVSRSEGLAIDPVEREMFGATHSEVGSYLLWLWGLPDRVTEAVTFHHRPAECPSQGMSPVIWVHAANALAHEFESGSESPSRLDETFIAAAGLSSRMAEWRRLARNAKRECEIA
jgi:putative nucleotidyltransferase with HDIG domain